MVQSLLSTPHKKKKTINTTSQFLRGDLFMQQMSNSLRRGKQSIKRSVSSSGTAHVVANSLTPDEQG